MKVSFIIGVSIGDILWTHSTIISLFWIVPSPYYRCCHFEIPHSFGRVTGSRRSMAVITIEWRCDHLGKKKVNEERQEGTGKGMNEGFQIVENESLVILVIISMTQLHKYRSITAALPVRWPSVVFPVGCSLHFHEKDNSYNVIWYQHWGLKIKLNNNLDTSEVSLRTLVIRPVVVISYSACQSPGSFVKGSAPNFWFLLPERDWGGHEEWLLGSWQGNLGNTRATRHGALMFYDSPVCVIFFRLWKKIEGEIS